MADDVIKRLLIKLGIDGDDAVEFIDNLQRRLDAMQSKQRAASAERKSMQQDDVSAMLRQADLAEAQVRQNQANVDVLRQQIESKQKSVQAIREEIAQEKAALDIRQATIKVMASQGDLQGTVLKGLQEQVAQERQILALKQAQLRAAAPASGGGEGSAVGRVMEAVGTGLFGGGLAGKVAGGALAGTLGAGIVIEGVEALADMVRELGKSLTEAMGPAQNLRVEFEKLASNKGNDPAALVQKLREATHGLVTDSQLYQTANVFLRSNMKLTTDQMTRMIKETVDLAALNGKSAPEAMQALSRAFESGQTRVLGVVTGLTTLTRQAQTFSSRGIDPATAATKRLEIALAALDQAAKKSGVPLTTLPDVLDQVKVEFKNFTDGIAEGILSTGKFGSNVEELSQRLIAATPKLMEAAKAIGVDLANAFDWIIKHWPEIKSAFEYLVAIKIGDWALGSAGKVLDLASAFAKLSEAVTAVDLAKALAKIGLPGLGGLLGRLGGTATTTVAEGAAGEAAGGVAGAAGAGAAGAGVASVGLTALIGIVVAATLAYLTGRAFGEYFNEDQKTGFPDSQGVIGYTQTGPVRGELSEEELTANAIASGKAVARPKLTVDRSTESKGGSDENQPWNDPTAARRMAELTEQIRREQAKVELEIAKSEIEAEQELIKNKYQLGLVSLQQYLDQQKALQQKAHDARVREINEDADAQIKAAKAKLAASAVPGGVAGQTVYPQGAVEQEQAQEQLINAKRNQQLLANDESLAKQEAELLAKDLSDRESAYKAYTNDILKIQKDGLAEQQKIAEQQFKAGTLSPDDYIAARKTAITQELALTQGELDEELKDTQKTEAEKAKIRVEQINATIAANRQLLDLAQQESQIRLEGIQNSYTRVKDTLAAAMAAAQLRAQQEGPGASKQDENAVLEQQSELNQEHIRQLTEAYQLLQSQPQQWAKVVLEIKAAVDEQIKLNEQLAQSKNFIAPLEGLFGQIASALGQAGASQWEKVFTSMQTSLKSLSSLFQQIQVQRIAKSQGNLGKGVGAFKPGLSKDEQDKILANQAYTQTVQDSVNSLKESASDEAKARKEASQEMTAAVQREVAEYKHATTTLDAFVEALKQGTDHLLGFLGGQAPERPSTEGLPFVGQRPTPAGVTAVGPSGQTGTYVATAINAGPQTPGASGGSGGGDGGSESDMSKYSGMIPKAKSDLADTMQEWINKIAGAIAAVGNFVNALENAKSGVQGAMTGGLSGMSAGGQVGNMIVPGMGGVVGSIVGGVGGAVFGGIFGSKEASMMKDVKTIQGQLQNIIDQLNDGTVSISTAIANLRTERQQAIAMLSGGKGSKSKKGQPSQLQAVLQQIDQQINQLVQEQQQLIDQMNQNILEMGQGIYWQPIIQNLDTIIQKYQQFASAASGNTQQMAAANEFLTQSLENYSQTMQQTMLADQEQAIQNALQLIQLQQEQVEMTNQYNESVYGILSQGVTSRQLSGAQTKGAEIEALNQQYSLQQQQMQQEIAVAQYKYQIQQKIFGLASTQVGLEMELVAVQDAQADQMEDGVNVLAQAIAAINEALASGNIGSLFGTGTQTGTQGLSGILQLLGLTPTSIPGVAGGGINYLSEIQGQYQGLASALNAVDPSFLTNLIEALMSPVGSSQRAALMQEIAQDKNDLIAQGFASSQVSGFETYVGSGTLPSGTPVPPAGSVYAEGTTYVPGTGIAQLEEGEAVIPADMNPWGSAGGGVPFSQGLMQSVNQQDVSEMSLQVEQQIYQLVMSRVNAEWALVNAKMQLLQMMSSQTGTTGVASFEGGLAKVYELRGRYGSGGINSGVFPV